ncbi:hypothetical protein [Acetoanaerobium noterae]|uniref:hypothetical protein n=1 Tax=Acetoanaerobium noterae TaxID=745369 RepID=UPI003324B264
MIIADNYFHDIGIYRNKQQMDEYFKLKIKEINSDPELTELAILKKGLFKEFLEEFYILYLYSISRYCPQNSKMKIIIGNQNYDALIYHDDRIEKLEISYFVYGKFENMNAKKIIENKIGLINKYIDLDYNICSYFYDFMNNYKKKCMKNYLNTTLIITLRTFDYFEVFDNSSKDFINIIIDSMAKINTNARRVLLMVINNDGIYNIDNNIYIVK